MDLGLSLLLDNADLRPAQSAKNRLLRKLQPGCFVEIEAIITDRSWPQLATFFCWLRERLDSCPEWFLSIFYENLIKDLTINGRIDEDTVYLLAKKALGIKSLSYKEIRDGAKATRKIVEIENLIYRWTDWKK